MKETVIKKIVPFVLAGLLSVVVNVGVLYMLTEWLGIWYLASSVIAFVASVISHFLVQKFWVFESDRNENSASKQFSGFVLLALINLGINSGLMYFAVSIVGLHYIFSQILIRGLLAVMNYFAYDRLIFK